MKYGYMLHPTKTRQPGEKCARELDSHISYLPQRLRILIEQNEYKISIAESVAQAKIWFPSISMPDFLGIALKAEKVVVIIDANYDNDKTSMYSTTAFHELLHAGHFLFELNLQIKWKHIYDEEKDLYRQGDPLGNYARSNEKEYFVGTCIEYHYLKVLGNDHSGLFDEYFGKTPKTVEFLESEVFNNKPQIIYMLEEAKLNGVKDVSLITAEESVNGNSGIKIIYKDDTWSAFDLPATGGGVSDSLIQLDNTINFETPYGGIPADKITYSIVEESSPTRYWLMTSYKISRGQEDITQERVLLQTNTNDSSTRAMQITERRFYDYNGSRNWTDWKRINQPETINLSLSTDKYIVKTTSKVQTITPTANATISLPSMSSYFEVDLYIKTSNDYTITFDKTVTWDTPLNGLKSGVQVFSLRYINSAIGWVGTWKKFT